MDSNRKVILYIATSLDGFIANPDGDISFLSVAEKEGEDYGYADFLKSIDTIIIGRKSYEKVISMGFDYPHSNKKVYIITRTKRPDIGSFTFYTDNLKELVLKLKNEEGKAIYIDGGAEIVHQLLQENLIDEFYITVIPTMLGTGIPLFKDGRPEIPLKLVTIKQFDKNIVQFHYRTIET